MTTNEIKPIETVYNGYRFRSRLEARWAVFFDALNIEYEYEPEGFSFDGTEYLPDFYLPDHEMYVEIKNTSAFKFLFGDNCVCAKDGNESSEIYLHFANKITQNGFSYLIVFGDPIDAFGTEAFMHSNGDNILFYREECSVHVIVSTAAQYHPIAEFQLDCGDCMRCTDFLSDMMACKVGLFMKDYVVAPMEHSVVPAAPTVESQSQKHKMPFEENVPRIKRRLPCPPMEAIDNFLGINFMNDANLFLEAAQQARQARFEHGETPK